MPTLNELPLPTSAKQAGTVERRREGRLDYSNPHLIDLLRRPLEAPEASQSPGPDFRLVDSSGAADVAVTQSPTKRSGVQRSVLPYVIVSSACFWAVITTVLWRIF